MEYADNGAPIPGLTGAATITEDGSTVLVRRQYSVVNVLTGASIDPNKLSFGGVFDASAINGATDTISIPGHSFVTGDYVVPDVSVGGLNLGNRYYVVVVDEGTIRLVAAADVGEGGLFAPTAVSGNTVTITGHGFEEGDAVTYDAPDPYVFANSLVDVNGFSDGKPVNDPSKNNIVFVDADGNPVAHGLQVGDKVVYTLLTSGGTQVDGLTSGQTYRVAAVTSSGIQLKNSDKLANLNVVYTLDGPRTKITRTDGAAWLANGFNANQQVTISSAEVTGTFTIDQVSGTNLWIASTGFKATRLIEQFDFNPFVDASPDVPATITRTIRNWSTDGFTNGTQIRIDGYSGTFTIASVSGMTATLSGSPSITDGTYTTTITRAVSGVVNDTFDSPIIALSLTKTSGTRDDGTPIPV